ncbi:MFS transporter [Deinococcus radiodurans]|jgi:Major Facilitator Superfamily.|uniref:Multidrug-efflux transporter, putative n=2 Tax=Bacteria TaxID=2 RepID=Q9RZF0_DEIRA|nr:MFS transporter [Deinococcus radiodurans]AAF12676.1 multidrug-efflux transporter, putative [Deinococcus radiodurans R1 = ATCC 13939 = DSM 20539]ANC73332.1 hypothetical protein A2G07_15895 [Deinococcus radiodurans R1 = ATCC 13939 = DSM 20539]QEM73377.1 MFS transporter [Deinococcus radiodurans]QIP30733.1 MFS transporter [Deinococcus radiodurans]QIP33638.1 MFS transporter [Deinococcus radiodurans]
MRKNVNNTLWILLAGSIVSETGMWIGFVGTLQFLQQVLSSTFNQALFLIVPSLLGLAIGPIAGRVVDQHAKQLILKVSSALRILAPALMLLAIEQRSIVFAVISTLIGGLVTSFYYPALRATFPLVASGQALAMANMWNFNLITLARIIGTTFGGLLIVNDNLEVSYQLAMLSYVVIALQTWLIRIDEDATSNRHNQVDSRKMAFTEVLRLIGNSRELVFALTINLIPYIFIAGFNIFVIGISTLQQNVGIKGALYTVEGVGILISSLFYRRMIKKFDVKNIILATAFLICAAELFLLGAGNKWLSILGFAIFGISGGFFIPTLQTFLQNSVENTYHGRLFSLKRMLETGITLVTLPFYGIVIDRLGITSLMAIILTLSTAIYLFAIAQLVGMNSRLAGERR